MRHTERRPSWSSASTSWTPRYLREEHGFNFLADIAAADYLDWGKKGVAGYWGTTRGAT